MNAAISKYRQIQVSTADKGQIIVMLYDGAIRFLSQAKERMAAGAKAEAGRFLSKAQRIVHELMNSLNFSVAPELCQNLASLYRFTDDQIIQANREQNPKRLEDAISLLSSLREGWQGAKEKVKSPLDKFNA